MPEKITISTPLGKITLIASEKHLCEVRWGGRSSSQTKHPLLLKAKRQLEEYFAGKRSRFDLPLAPQGTDFQKRVWQELVRIPYGETLSYREQALRLGDVKKARAVGTANGKNPLSIIVPCHRVIASNGKLAGFAGGLKAKSWLLAHEGKRQLSPSSPKSRRQSVR